MEAGGSNNNNNSYQSINSPKMTKRMSELRMEEDFGDTEHQTSFWQTFMSLVKGYIGCGILSLPWAVSQLGIPLGCFSIALMALWSSYNCWTVVKLKRFIEGSTEDTNLSSTAGDESEHNNDPETNNNENDDAASDAPSQASASTNVTYPHLGDWAYGKQFQSYVAACICTQQLAICTVYISFIGENLLAVLEFFDIYLIESHFAKMTVALPMVLTLSFLPSLKKLAPVMVAGLVLLLVGFASLAVIGGLKWEDRPEHAPEIYPPKAPLAVASILFSYEGICLVLPVESAMKEPKNFRRAFEYAMVAVATVMALVACLSTAVFGDVTNGSITAFLLKIYKHDPSVKLWLMVSNTAVSLSILHSYPLQLVPAAEILGPWMTKMNAPCADSKMLATMNDDDDDDKDLAGFEPLPPLPEHQTSNVESIPPQQGYDSNNNEDNEDHDDDDDDDAMSRSGMESVRSLATNVVPEMTMLGDSPSLRLFLVLITYTIAVAVPNVENLISLAGAVAGSSTALLIPPILDLAWYVL
jgi:proton-coupled amino acid transporter